MAEKPKLELPYHVRLVGSGAFVEGYEGEVAAIQDAANRNKRSEELGLRARYEVKAKA